MSGKTNSSTLIQNRISKPKLYAVTLHNDDYTTMDFVTLILIKIYHKTEAEATSIMLNVHNLGKCIVDIYTLDIAMTKKMQTQQLANEKGFPLKVTVDEVMQ